MKVFYLFTGRLVLLTLALAGMIGLLQWWLDPFWIHEKTGVVLLFYFVLTLPTGLLALYLLKISEENSVSILLGMGLIRLLGSLAFVFVLLKSGVENILWFVTDFFIIYLLYLLFDIYVFITNLRPHSE